MEFGARNYLFNFKQNFIEVILAENVGRFSFMKLVLVREKLSLAIKPQLGYDSFIGKITVINEFSQCQVFSDK